MISSIPVERQVLGGLIKYPEVFSDVDVYVNPNDFYHDVHGTIYSMIRQMLSMGEKIDKVVLAQKLTNLGVKFKDDIDIFTYIESITFTQINPNGVVDACRELIALRVRREVSETAGKIMSLMKNPGDKSTDALIAEADALYHGKISAYELNSEPENIFENIEQLVEERGNNPVEEIGLTTPFPEFNRLYGGLKNKNVYAIVSRPGEGKTTFLNYLSFYIAQNNPIKIRALALDTEMETVDIKFRMVAAITGVPMWYLESGNWRRDPEMTIKVRAAWATIKKYELFHYQVGNKNVDEVASIIRRWYFSKVGRGNQGLVSYDYIKLTGEKIGQNFAEHQAIGEKVNKLKAVIGEIDAPLLTAMQMNRSGENFNRKSTDLIDDATAISLSDRLQWFGTLTAIFRRKTLDEITLDGVQFGTHKFIKLKSRFQGRDAAGHQDFLKRRDENGNEKYAMNYLNFNVTDFKVEEKGSLRDVIANAAAGVKVSDKNVNDGDVL